MSTPVTPQLVKQLRDRTDQPMGLCKKALDQNAGDMQAAIDWLRSQNKNMGVAREANETAEGRNRHLLRQRGEGRGDRRDALRVRAVGEERSVHLARQRHGQARG